MTIAVVLQRLGGATEAQAAFIAEAVRRLEQAINRPELVQRIRELSFASSEFLDAAGNRTTLDNAQVVALLTEGRERGTDADARIDLEVELADLPAPSAERPGTVGFAVPGRQPITTARWFVDACMQDHDLVRVAGHLLHEWLHIAGLIHFPDNSARDDPPYLIGEVVQSLIDPSPYDPGGGA